MRVSRYSIDYTYPASTEPEWSSLVERWYQLDAAAYGVSEVYWRHRARLQAAPPQWIFLASPGASNFTDRQFVLSATPSPAKFVHTLPNIRSAALLQVMNWSGQVLCVQNDPATIETALNEAAEMAAESGGDVWLTGSTVRDNGFSAYLFVVGREGDYDWDSSTPGVRS